MSAEQRFRRSKSLEPAIGERVSLGGIPGRYIGRGRGVYLSVMTGNYEVAAVQDPKDAWLGEDLARRTVNDPLPSREVARRVYERGGRLS